MWKSIFIWYLSFEWRLLLVIFFHFVPMHSCEVHSPFSLDIPEMRAGPLCGRALLSSTGDSDGGTTIRQLLHKSGQIFVLFFKNNSHYRYYRYPIQSEVIWEVLLKSSPTEGFILINTNRKFDKIHFSSAIQFYVLKWFEEFKNLINWLN